MQNVVPSPDASTAESEDDTMSRIVVGSAGGGVVLVLVVILIVVYRWSSRSVLSVFAIKRSDHK